MAFMGKIVRNIGFGDLPTRGEDERASLRRDADDVVIRFAGILEIAGAQLKPASFWAVSLTDRVYVAAGGRPR